jgi:hypothetical protein
MQHNIWNFAGQLYAQLGTQPYRRRDGTSAELTVWLTHCATCGVLFEVMTPEKVPKYLTRRCSKHMRQGRKVKKHIHWGKRIPLDELLNGKPMAQIIKRTAAMFLAEPATVLTTPIGE